MATNAASEVGLAGRYATALFELAQDARAVDRVADDLAKLTRALEASTDLQRLVRSPVITREDQGRAMGALLKALDVHPLTAQTIGLIAQKRRLFVVADIIAAYRRLVAALKGEVTAEVATARALKPAEEAELAAALKQALGRDVAIESRVDPALIGGIVVKVGSRMIDNSLRNKLQRLQLAMRGTA